MSYNHAFTLAFEVKGSIDASGNDVTPQMYLAALKERVARLEADPTEIPHVMDAPFDSMKEDDQWVLRAPGRKGCVFGGQGSGWLHLDPANQDDIERLNRTAMSQEAADTMASGPAGYLSRVEDAFNSEVLVEMKSDDGMITARVDIANWLKLAHADDLQAMQQDRWAFGESMDRIFYDLEGDGHPSANRLSAYLGLNPTMVNGDQVGFSVRVEDPEDLMSWMQENRPDIAALLQGEDTPEL